MTEYGIPNVYHGVITDKDDEIVDFYIANNMESSSIFELGEKHIQNHPEVYYTEKITQKTITIDTFFKKNNLSPEKCVFWNFDIQGAELLALKGAPEAIKYAKIMYLEVNEAEIYKNCARLNEIDAFLEKHGFKRVYDILSDSSGWGDAIYVRV
jgi:Methyltransferase FkbM domain